ncbi:MAG TPA: DUF6323 family protein [Candidatus Nitrosocosmicus sp.]|nr:DUF6323 family protein [Candidatus Nitrosocosmicus sp.]
MALPGIFRAMGPVMQELQRHEILETNAVSGKYGLALTEEEAAEIVEVRNQLLQGYGRVELDMEAARKLIYSFSASPFVSQEDYSSGIKELQEVFYYLKSETNDELGDDKLIEIIMEMLNDSCEGAIELLKGRELEAFVREHRLKCFTNNCL